MRSNTITDSIICDAVISIFSTIPVSREESASVEEYIENTYREYGNEIVNGIKNIIFRVLSVENMDRSKLRSRILTILGNNSPYGLSARAITTVIYGKRARTPDPIRSELREMLEEGLLESHKKGRKIIFKVT
jgi:hypothetical protein